MARKKMLKDKMEIESKEQFQSSIKKASNNMAKRDEKIVFSANDIADLAKTAYSCSYQMD